MSRSAQKSRGTEVSVLIEVANYWLADIRRHIQISASLHLVVIGMSHVAVEEKHVRVCVVIDYSIIARVRRCRSLGLLSLDWVTGKHST